MISVVGFGDDVLEFIDFFFGVVESVEFFFCEFMGMFVFGVVEKFDNMVFVGGEVGRIIG